MWTVSRYPAQAAINGSGSLQCRYSRCLYIPASQPELSERTKTGFYVHIHSELIKEHLGVSDILGDIEKYRLRRSLHVGPTDGTNEMQEDGPTSAESPKGYWYPVFSLCTCFVVMTCRQGCRYLASCFVVPSVVLGFTYAISSSLPVILNHIR
jgi:hypothetical protein